MIVLFLKLYWILQISNSSAMHYFFGKMEEKVFQIIILCHTTIIETHWGKNGENFLVTNNIQYTHFPMLKINNFFVKGLQTR